MMEYIIITAVFLLGVGGMVYFGGSFKNMFPGLMSGEQHSQMYFDGLKLVPVGEASTVELKQYGLAGSSFAAKTKEAQKLIAMPML